MRFFVLMKFEYYLTDYGIKTETIYTIACFNNNYLSNH
jgi:hypothetical protein